MGNATGTQHYKKRVPLAATGVAANSPFCRRYWVLAATRRRYNVAGIGRPLLNNMSPLILWSPLMPLPEYCRKVRRRRISKFQT
ncbi:hypothetical protein HanIR_Chr14g0716411 [Helianthus annuus]|nr:hypothetical protein HanIR_Chr14g0716411 [Helianthus annuus]